MAGKASLITVLDVCSTLVLMLKTAAGGIVIVLLQVSCGVVTPEALMGLEQLDDYSVLLLKCFAAGDGMSVMEWYGRTV